MCRSLDRYLPSRILQASVNVYMLTVSLLSVLYTYIPLTLTIFCDQFVLSDFSVGKQTRYKSDYLQLHLCYKRLMDLHHLKCEAVLRQSKRKVSLPI
jgi:hypothetical protein